MSSRLRCAAAATALLVCAACGTPAPDYQSIWSTTTTPSAPVTSEPPVPFSQYLTSVGVQGEAVAPADLTGLTVTLVRPDGWSTYRNDNLAPQTEAIARDNGYPTATVLVFRLEGGFDVPAAIRHANADALLSPGFAKLNESFADFGGFPSAMIEGSYNGPSDGPDERRLHSYSRIVIPVTPEPDFQRYLVQLTITGLADQAVADSADIEEIIEGFEVTVP
ncbi:LpqN/LpqT family lipoprotein [[Mycobacterium] burgundiense]|uniref:LpqN/LpqT family lipoprotein n=1 Tax=[Mycobacterium] burgundiense TaxID=3064286 RepID=A0ABM9LDY4_9MYCO|nr:LpqN/LpqT family lipoprotein [Mycolicibacterium sp. MU0053]CAJ1497367.1 LpqN/LpqT family lipoprotein [Mycolicibacterium sp. MU0053]